MKIMHRSFLRALTLLGCGLLSCAASAQAPAPIKLGIVAELTGPVAIAGTAALIGTRLGVEDINKNGGILGRQVELIVADNQSDPSKSVGEVQRLINQQKVDALIGPMTSPSNIAIAPSVSAAKLFHVSHAGSLQMTPERAPYQFGLLVNANSQARAMVNHVSGVLKAKSAAILTDDTAQSKDGAEAMKKALTEKGVKLTGALEFKFNSTDVTPQLLNLRRENPEVILMFAGTATDFAAVVKGLGDIGWDVKVVGADGAFSLAPGIVAAAGPDAYKNLVGTTMKVFTYCGAEPAVGQSEVAKLFEKLKAFAPNDFGKASPQHMAWFYDGVHIFKQAAEGAGSLDAVAMTDWLIKNAAKVKTVAGPISPTASSHFLWDENALTVVEHPEIKRADGLAKRGGC